MAAPVFHRRAGRFVCESVITSEGYVSIHPQHERFSHPEHPTTNRPHKNNTTLINEGVRQEDNKKKRSGGGFKELLSKWRFWRSFRLPTFAVGLLTTPALDLDSLECSSHRGLRSIIR
jgi:hypothetical protein